MKEGRGKDSWTKESETAVCFRGHLAEHPGVPELRVSHQRSPVSPRMGLYRIPKTLCGGRGEAPGKRDLSVKSEHGMWASGLTFL